MTETELHQTLACDADCRESHEIEMLTAILEDREPNFRMKACCLKMQGVDVLADRCVDDAVSEMHHQAFGNSCTPFVGAAVYLTSFFFTTCPAAICSAMRARSSKLLAAK